MMPVRRTQGWLPGILDDFFGNEWVDKTSSTAPAVNVIETDKEYKVEIAAPGLTRDDFKIDINEDNELTVSMEKKVEKNEESEKEGYWTLHSTVLQDNTASLGLHTKCGFRVVGRRERIARDCHGRWLDTYLMERRAKADEPAGYKKL